MKKVSIIVPCYNSEPYIERFLENILAQTYKNLELILVNDGSSDKTEELIFNYKEKLEKAKIELKYYKKENGGAASALNLGLKIFTGDYLIWPDSDDILHPESIMKRVQFLEDNPEYDLVRSNIKIVAESNIEKKIGNIYSKHHHDKDIFLHMILEKISACPGAFMLKKENIKKNIPDLDIYESQGGQNWQIELPNTYNQKCGFINEELYTYVVRGNSHSHQNSDDLLHMIERWKEHKKILDITIP
ncbi:MAG: glycosyltransferase family 2 protein, partial [Fusobacteriaceae bacterium]